MKSSRSLAPELGFLYATRLGTARGSRPGSTIAPTIAVPPAGRPIFALGGAGDARIVSALEKWGFKLTGAPSGFFGRVHAVSGRPVAGGAGTGVAEPRWTGGAAGPVK